MKLPQRCHVVLYSQEDCHLCQEARAQIERVQRCIGFRFREMDIAADPALLARYVLTVPVVAVDGREALVSRVSALRLLWALLQ